MDYNGEFFLVLPTLLLCLIFLAPDKAEAHEPFNTESIETENIYEEAIPQFRRIMVIAEVENPSISYTNFVYLTVRIFCQRSVRTCQFYLRHRSHRI